jgi:hypothetical protein
MLRPAVSQLDFGAHRSQQLAGSFNVAHLRNIFQNDRLFREQGRGHGRQRGILGTTDPNCTQAADCRRGSQTYPYGTILMAMVEKSVPKAVTR